MPDALKQLILTLAFGMALDAHAADIKSARIWPAQDYTRLTIESDQPIKQNLLSVKNPDRLVLDLEQTQLTPVLADLATKVGNDDPYVKSIRVGRYKPGVVRVVLDLKTSVEPQIFMLKPISEYGHRLVLDIYPPKDALMSLLAKPKAPDAKPDAAKPEAAKADSSKAEPREKLADGKKDGAALSRPIIIAVDAGHGGEDPGAHGKHGSHEKNITLAIARKLKAAIDEEPNMHAVLTRDGDYFIPLQGRVIKARRAKADLFISVHADAFIRPDARGSSVFALSESGATSAAARWLARRENEADLIGGVNLDVKDPFLAKTLLDLSQTATINDSLRLARDVLKELGSFNSLHKGEVEQAGFAVLKAPDIPSILVETAFISNPEEETRLTDQDYQEKIAEAILGGVKHYFAKNPALARSKLVYNR